MFFLVVHQVFLRYRSGISQVFLSDSVGIPFIFHRYSPGIPQVFLRHICLNIHICRLVIYIYIYIYIYVYMNISIQCLPFGPGAFTSLTLGLKNIQKQVFRQNTGFKNTYVFQHKATLVVLSLQKHKD